MIADMFVYLAWILFTVGIVAFIYHLLRLDRPRQVEAPVSDDDQS